MRACLFFAKRNFLEIARDPLSYIFCLGFPIVMLFVMTTVNASIPKQAGMTLFQLQNLMPGIAVFSLTFTTLFSAMTVARDRSCAFLKRLYASPLRGFAFFLGYSLPVLMIAFLQCAVTVTVSLCLGAFTGIYFSFFGILGMFAALLPAMLLFIALGVLFGACFSERAAPGVCSILISVAGVLGGIWMDIGNMSGGLAAAAKILPFYHCVHLARQALAGEPVGNTLLFVCLYTAALVVLAPLVFDCRRQKDLK